MTNKTIRAELQIGAKDTTGNVFRSVAGKSTALADRVQALNRRIDSSNRSLTQSMINRMNVVERISDRVTKVLAASAVAYTGAQMFKDFAQWDRKMTRIGITAGAKSEEINAATDSLFRYAKEFAVAPDELVKGIDTLVAGGKSLQESLDFLPAVAKAAQASGSEIEGMANTALKLSGALGITTDKIGQAFDMMVAQGKAGQFEMKDMAAEIPNAASAYGLLADKGTAGLARLNAMLQTLREGTATSSEAANQAVNIFTKVNSQETINKFKKMGVDVTKEMAAAKAKGTPPMEAFVDITRRTLKGDLNKLPQLFQDQQVLLGMTSLLTKQDSYKRYLAAATDKSVPGTVDRDLKRITADAQSAIDRMYASVQRMTSSIGKAIQEPVIGALDTISEETDKESAVRAGLGKRGYTGLQKELALLSRLPIGPFPASADYEQLAREGGYVPANRPDLKALQRSMPFAYNILGRYPQRPISRRNDPNFDGSKPLSALKLGRDDGFDQIKADIEARLRDDRIARIRAAQVPFAYEILGRQPNHPSSSLAQPEKSGWLMNNSRLQNGDILGALLSNINPNYGAATADSTSVKATLEADGKAAGDHLKEGGEAILQAIQRSANMLIEAAARAAASISSAKPAAAVNQPMKVNANTGKTNTFVNSPATLGHR